MRIGIFTLLALLYTSTHVAAQLVFVCDCETDGIHFDILTETCCIGVGGLPVLFNGECQLQSIGEFQTCCIDNGRGDGCTPA
ncbi:hypothetical protein C8R43DRAFT_1135655 [Mycena crocata]|nr:hypothetical protein C8R43DRAFT_1135655 [Mycena crocata]